MGLFYVVSSWLSVAHYLISATIVNQHASWRFSAALFNFRGGPDDFKWLHGFNQLKGKLF